MTKIANGGGSAHGIWRREIACAGNPQAALCRALADSPIKPAELELWMVRVGHDAKCPALGLGPIRDCTCEILRIEARPPAPAKRPSLKRLRREIPGRLDSEWRSPEEIRRRLGIRGATWERVVITLERLANDGLIEIRVRGVRRSFRRAP